MEHMRGMLVYDGRQTATMAPRLTSSVVEIRYIHLINMIHLGKRGMKTREKAGPGPSYERPPTSLILIPTLTFKVQVAKPSKLSGHNPQR